jgi:hypothetical protein
MKRSEAIKNLLTARTHPDLAALYNPHMEVQVNVSQGTGERVDKDYKGKHYQSYSDGIENWSHFRLPHNAKTEPEDNDHEISFDLSKHVEAIGCTGWDWHNRVSRWVAFDFDAIAGHSDKHKKKLTDAELTRIKDTVSALEWVTVRLSTGGKGLHLYVFLDCVPTANHTEHAALARAILGLMASLTGLDLESTVDACGGNIWLFRTTMTPENRGLTLLKQGSILQSVPTNWQDHVPVVKGKSKRIVPAFIAESDVDGVQSMFDELTAAKTQVALDAEHQRLIRFLHETHATAWYDTDLGMLVTHTSHLAEAHDKLGLKGFFKTIATGSQHGTDHNTYLFPLRGGAWVVRRFTKGTGEDPSWGQDTQGWTRCFFNRLPDLRTACKSKESIEQVSGGFSFREAEVGLGAAQQLGIDIKLPSWANSRQFVLKEHRDGRIIAKLKREDSDPADQMMGWQPDGKTWTRIYDAPIRNHVEPEIKNFDATLRHLITEGGEDSGWTLRSENDWRMEPLIHVRTYLKALGYKPSDGDNILGSCIARPWKLVCQPFQLEEPGNRSWNRNAPQLRFLPTANDDLHYDHWLMILNHLGKNLNDPVKENKWCQDAGVLTGADYLKVWIASMFKEPLQPLPYLFFFGPQNNGKSIFHEAISLLVTQGVKPAGTALISQSGFNGELENVILAYVEEIDLRLNRVAYTRIKDWVTCINLQIHPKGGTPYEVPNTVHWVHTANNYQACPISVGDSRVVMVEVEPLINPIPKKQLLPILEKEAPDFLAAILRLELPKSNDRLNIPIVDTEAKVFASHANESYLDLFIREKVHHVTGSYILLGEFYDRFKEWLDADQVSQWSKIKMGKELPSQFPKGRLRQSSQMALGNMSWEPRKPDEAIKPRLIVKGECLIPDLTDLQVFKDNTHLLTKDVVLHSIANS